MKEQTMDTDTGLPLAPWSAPRPHELSDWRLRMHTEEAVWNQQS